MKSRMQPFAALVAAICSSIAALPAARAGNSIEVASGLVSRSIDTRDGHLRGASYKTADGTEFMQYGAPEFAFRTKGRLYTGHLKWKDVADRTSEKPDGARTVTVTAVSADGVAGIEMSYTTYPGLSLVRKTLTIENRTDADLAIEDVDVETFKLGILRHPAEARVMRRFGRYREEGEAYFGDWNDPLVVVHQFSKRRGIAVGNEGVATMKRTTAFQEGSFIVSGTPHRGERYPFRKWLKPGERWTAMPVFTAPYVNCADPSRVVEGAVSDYVRKYMGTSVERLAKKPMFVYNTYVPFSERINDALVRSLADVAAECGVEEFVIDWGWSVTKSDGRSGYGDWVVDQRKFPNGLKATFDYVRSKGMKPGLWISLAFAHPAAAPLAEHPEWFVRNAKGGIANLHETSGGLAAPRTACMATPWRDYIRDRILRLVEECGLSYVKLDLSIATSAYIFSDVATGCYAKDHPGHRGREDSFEAIYAGTMKLFDELHESAPELFIDCTFETAGKMYLMDYGIAKHADGNWLANIPSTVDGQLYVRNLAWGRTPAIPASSLVIGNLRMDGPGHLLSFKSLAGTLPIMLGDLRRLTKEERAEYRVWSGWLKELEKRHSYMSFRQDLPGFGEPLEGAWDGFTRINTETKSGGLVGVFRRGGCEDSRRVSVRGLDPAARYAVFKGARGEKIAETTGAELMAKGFPVTLPVEIDGELFEIRRCSPPPPIAAPPVP